MESFPLKPLAGPLSLPMVSYLSLVRGQNRHRQYEEEEVGAGAAAGVAGSAGTWEPEGMLIGRRRSAGGVRLRSSP